MLYPEELIDEIRTRNDIVDVISSYVRLQKKGSNYFGLCPFHNEKSPSFSVSPQKQIYYCFGCQAGGNVIRFVQQYENYTFQEALKFLADRAGVKLPEITYSEEGRKRADLRSGLLEVNKEAGKYYYYQLRQEGGAAAMNYLTGRGLSDEIIRRFGLGYARPGQDLLYRYLKSKDFSDDLLRQSGIFSFDERRGMTDKFWSRVIFPIMDINHRIIGFGGRTLGEGKPKYLNSPETAIFDKGRNLYGLNHARTARKKNIILCEGYMDVISLHQAGFSQAVASLGTALTSGQASLLKRYSEEVILSYDSDGAGINAARRAIRVLREVGISAKVLNLQPYKDPDEFIKHLGVEAFERRIDSAENGFVFEIRKISEEHDLKDPHGKTKFAEAVAEQLLVFEEEIERDNYLDAIAKEYFLNADSLKKLVAKTALKREGMPVYERPKSGINREKPEDGALKAQRMLLTWLTEQPQIYDEIRDYLGVNDFSEPVYCRVAELLFEQLQTGKADPAGILSRFEDEEMQDMAAGVFHTPLSDVETVKEKEKALKELLILVRTNSVKRMDDISQMIALKKQTEEIAKITLHLK